MNQTFINREDLGVVWYSEKDCIDIESISLPLIQHEIVINLGDLFSINDSTNYKKILFSGIKSSTTKTKVQGKYQAAGILMNPTKIYQVFGLTMREFNAEVNSNPDYLLFDKKHDLLEELIDAGFSEKTTILSNFFLRNSMRKEYPDLVDKLIIFLSPNNFDNTILIKKIADEINFTPKHLIARFKDITGITPKKFFQINQINHASRLMWGDKSRTLTNIALECGFYDQSHFVRTFKNITDLTPSYFRKQQMDSGFSFPNTILK